MEDEGGMKLRLGQAQACVELAVLMAMGKKSPGND